MEVSVEIGDIVTLENGKEYILLEMATYREAEYFYAAEVDENEELVGNYLFFEKMVDGEDNYLTEISDPELISELTLLVQKIVVAKLKKGYFGEEG